MSAAPGRLRAPARRKAEGVQAFSPAVVVVKSPGGLGSAFIVHADGYLSTNFPVIKGLKHFTVTQFVQSGEALIRVIHNQIRIVALDAQNATIELLSIVKGALTEAVSFQVFQGPQFNRKERGWYYGPREVAAGDLNADRRMDLGILVHDKLVIHMDGTGLNSSGKPNPRSFQPPVQIDVWYKSTLQRAPSCRM